MVDYFKLFTLQPMWDLWKGTFGGVCVVIMSTDQGHVMWPDSKRSNCYHAKVKSFSVTACPVVFRCLDVSAASFFLSLAHVQVPPPWSLLCSSNHCYTKFNPYVLHARSVCVQGKGHVRTLHSEAGGRRDHPDVIGGGAGVRPAVL